MSKLAILAGLLFLWAAAAHKTTITTVEVDGGGSNWDWPWPSWKPEGKSCSERLQQADLSQCEKYIRQKVQGSDEEQSNVVLKMRPIVTRKSSSSSSTSSSEECEEKCCQQLRGLQDTWCQCRAFPQIMQRIGEKVEGKGEMMQDMMRELKNLPDTCDLPNEEQLKMCIPGMGF